MKPVSVMEGESVSLHTDTEMRKNDLILWRFGKYPIVQINGMAQNVTVHNVLEGIFTDRLNVDPHTGSLTIISTRTEHTGVYLLEINSIKKIFILSVYGESLFYSLPVLDSVYASLMYISVLYQRKQNSVFVTQLHFLNREIALNN